MPRKPAKKKHQIEIEGALVFRGHLEIYKTPTAGKYIIVAQTQPKNGEER